MKRQFLPLTLMLFAGLIVSLVTYLKGYSLTTMLIVLLSTFVVFYFIGSIIKMILDGFYKENEKKPEEDEGEVIEKSAKEENEAEN